MTMAAGSMAEGRQVWQAVAESLHFETQSGDEMLRMAWAFETSKSTTSHIPSPTGPCLLILPKQFHQLGASIKIYEPMCDIHITSSLQTVKLLALFVCIFKFWV